MKLALETKPQEFINGAPLHQSINLGFRLPSQ